MLRDRNPSQVVALRLDIAENGQQYRLRCLHQMHQRSM